MKQYTDRIIMMDSGAFICNQKGWWTSRSLCERKDHRECIKCEQYEYILSHMKQIPTIDAELARTEYAASTTTRWRDTPIDEK